MHNLRCLIFGLMVLGFFSGARTEGADWKYLKTTTQGEFFYDRERISRSSAHIVGVWLRIVYSKEFKEKERLDDLTQAVGLWEINCRDKRVCLLSTTHYSGEGEISPPQVWLPPEWNSIGPDTIMDALYNELCEKEGCIFEGHKE